MHPRFALATTISYVVFACCVLAGCAAPLSTASTTAEELAGTSKGAVAMMVSFEGTPIDKCGFISVESSLTGGQPIPRKVPSRGDPALGFWILEPGTYDVNAIYCVDGLNMVANAGHGKYMSYAKFSVAAGEVVDAGQLVISGQSGQRTLRVIETPPDRLAQLNRDFPKLATRLIKRPMVTDQANTNAQELALEAMARKELTLGNILPKALNNPVPVYRPH